MKKSLLLAALILNAGIATAADTASWTTWSPATPPAIPAGTFIQNSNSINVTYSGQYDWVDYGAYIFDTVPSSFTSPTVTNTPGSNGTIAMTGGNTGINSFHFSQAVIDPLVAVWSVGQSNVPVKFDFLNSPFSILSQGAGYWAGGTVTQSGNSITGLEGNALLQFKGSYTDLYFTTPNYEYYYGITVGALLAPVPEPETYAMLLAGLGLMGAIARRRKNRPA